MNDDLAPSQMELDVFFFSAKNGNASFVAKFLDQYPAAVDRPYANGDTALILAASQQRKNVVELLLAKGADVNAPNDYGITPLMEAVWIGSTEIVLLLLEKGADIKKTEKHGKTAWQFAVQGGRGHLVTLLDKWPELLRAREEAQAAELSAKHQEKLKKSRPVKPVLKRKFP